ncbi:MAG: type I restriction endonuclease subunit R [Pontiellaceae bacterium]|nr:type I restriction endonuclease subunit R [Pontiellaceae bacterium]
MQDAREKIFQQDIINHLVSHGWSLGESSEYDQKHALYTDDLVGYLSETQPDQWAKFSAINPKGVQDALLRSVARQLDKKGTLHVLRNVIKDRGAKFRLCQFKPDHDLNPDTMLRYRANRLRVVPELNYSATDYNGRLDLALFVNGIPVATLELKSEFKQSVERAVRQYRIDRKPMSSKGKPEPLLSFKRGALVHFAVSQYEIQMTTHLQGLKTFFLPFNKGGVDGGAGNVIPPDGGYATKYLWEDVFAPDNWLKILGRFIHLQVEQKEDALGKKYTKETMIFPRYHQWDVVNKLVDSARSEGAGQKYLVQHSAGSGKSNSIAWTAHQLASLYVEDQKVFNSVIVVTDRTVLDSQLQETIYQFDHAEGVVCRINREEGEGSKSEQLAQALEQATPIIIVTIQTFPFVLEAIRKRTTLKGRKYAVIADEAHSSQSGQTARQLREVLNAEQLAEDEELSSEDLLSASIMARGKAENLSFFAFTATPKAKTIELFGRCPDPAAPPSDENIPQAFHVYTMRQAIEEGFILDVLKNYTTYNMALKLAQKTPEADSEVERKRAAIRIGQWLRLHPTNITRKVEIIIIHFKECVAPLLNGKAKAMVVTGSRKEAVRYKLAFDKYIREHGINGIQAMVAFSGDVDDPESGPEPFTERNMNPNLKGRDMRKAFDTDEYQVMLVANKFQTGFDQPKLCAMYVDKKLKGVDCVQTLSRLNRTYAGKQTFVLDFVNDPEDILDAFRPYYRTAELANVSDPNLVYDLHEKLCDERIFEWHEVEAFALAFYDKKQGQNALAAHCKPAVDRWRCRYVPLLQALEEAEYEKLAAEAQDDKVAVHNAEERIKEIKADKNALDIFKKDLGSFVRYYEFMSQLVDYDDEELEKLSLYARHLRPLLREDREEVKVDLSDVEMTHFRLSKQGTKNLKLADGADEDYRLKGITDIGGGRFKDQELEFLSVIIAQLNELFAGDFSDADVLNYANTIADKVRENQTVMDQLKNNSPDQAMLGDLPNAIETAVIDSMDIHSNLANQLLEDEHKAASFGKLLLELLIKGIAA